MNEPPMDMNERKLISLDSPAQIDYWSRTLQVSPAELRQAVKAAGPELLAIRLYFAEK